MCIERQLRDRFAKKSPTNNLSLISLLFFAGALSVLLCFFGVQNLRPYVTPVSRRAGNFGVKTCATNRTLAKARKGASGKLVLVTGVAGFIGSHVAKQCLALNVSVVGVDDLSGGFRSNMPIDDERFTFVHLDVRDADGVDRLMSTYKFHAVYHLGAYAAEGMSHFIRSYNYRTNLVGSVQLLNSAVKSGVKTFLFASSIAVYGTGRTPLSEDMPVNPEDPYGISKYAMELDLKAARVMFGINYIIFRPHNVYGPGQNVHDRYRNVVGIFFNQLLRKQPMTIFGNGRQTRAFSYIDGVARPIALAPFVPSALNQVINVGGDQPYKVLELAKTVGKVLGMKRAAIKFLNARHEVMHAQADHGKLRCIFGSAATDGVQLEEGLRRTADWLTSGGASLTSPVEFSEVEVLKNMPPSWRTRRLREKPEIILSDRSIGTSSMTLDKLLAESSWEYGEQSKHGVKRERIPNDVLLVMATSGVWNATEKGLVSLANVRDKFDLLVVDEGREKVANSMLQSAAGSRVLEVPAGVGLTFAWNAGYKYFKENAQYKHIVIANNDMLFPDGTINRLREALRSGYGIACPISTFRGAGHRGERQGIEHVFNLKNPDSIKRVNNPFNYAYTQATLDRFFELHGQREQRTVRFSTDCNGFMFALSRRAAAELEADDEGNLFNKALYNVHQEGDLSRRIRAKGVRIALLRDTFTFHYKGSTMTRATRK